MSANVESMAYAFDKNSKDAAYGVPWHRGGNGVWVPGITKEEFQKASGLTYEVFKQPLFAELPDGRKISTGHSALLRRQDGVVFDDERPLDVVTDGWIPVQSTELFDCAEFWVKHGAEWNTAGSLDGGRMTWVLLKLKESFSLFAGKDTIESYLLFSNPHKYGYGVVICGTDVRVVCQNTIQLALGGRGKSELNVSFNHRRQFDAEVVQESLGVAKEKLNKYKEAAEFLASKRFRKEQLEEYFRTIFPSASENKKEKLELSRPAKDALSYLDNQPGVELGEGSWWQPFNAVTFYVDHKAGQGVETRHKSAVYGPGKAKKLLALEKALEFANAA